MVWICRFIEKYGTHVVVGVKMGGKDVIHMRQLKNSNLEPTEVQKLLKQLADEQFSEDGNTNLAANPDTSSSRKSKVGLVPYSLEKTNDIVHLECSCQNWVSCLQVEQSIKWDLQLPFASTVRPPVTSHSKTDVSLLSDSWLIHIWVHSFRASISWCRICLVSTSGGEDRISDKVIISGFQPCLNILMPYPCRLCLLHPCWVAFEAVVS